MRSVKKTIVLGYALGCLFFPLLALNPTDGAARARNKVPRGALTVPLDSLQGLDVKSFSEDPSVPLKAKTVVTNYRGITVTAPREFGITASFAFGSH